MNDFDKPVRSIKAIAEPFKSLDREAVLAYTPIVEEILRSGSRDAQHIEHTLDGLLDFCSEPEILLLYRKLCCHYFFIDWAAAVDYIQIYRERWDPEQRKRGDEDHRDVVSPSVPRTQR
jgi:hypothetical protein